MRAARQSSFKHIHTAWKREGAEGNMHVIPSGGGSECAGQVGSECVPLFPYYPVLIWKFLPFSLGLHTPVPYCSLSPSFTFTSLSLESERAERREEKRERGPCNRQKLSSGSNGKTEEKGRKGGPD